jgi:hypothetical protein
MSTQTSHSSFSLSNLFSFKICYFFLAHFVTAVKVFSNWVTFFFFYATIPSAFPCINTISMSIITALTPFQWASSLPFKNLDSLLECNLA